MTNHTSNIQFSAFPGAYERHLQRKYNNPLFPDAERFLLDEEVSQARTKDQQDLQTFFAAFEQAVQQAARMAGSVDADVILDLKQELERLYVHSCSLAGELDQHRQALRKLLQVCMNTIEKGASDDVLALQKLKDEISAREMFFHLLDSRLVADLMRGDEIIKPHELIPTLLSENTEFLPNVLELFDTDQISEISEQARYFIDSLPPDIVQSRDITSRLQIIENTK